MPELLPLVDPHECKLASERATKILEKTLLRDLFASFRFSQGSANLHGELFRGIRTTYEMQLGEDGYSHLQTLLSDTTKLNTDKMRIPGLHYKGRGDSSIGPDADFSYEAGHFLGTLKGLPAGDPTDIFQRIGWGIIDRDDTYQKSKRSHTPADVHKSYFREHVLGLEPTGNETFDIIFGLVSATFDLDNWPYSQATLTDLIDGWHENHPTEVFLSE